MKNLLIICSLILLLFCNVFAVLPHLTVEEHIKESDLVVIGTLKSISENEYSGTINGQGNIEIEIVLSKNVKTNEDTFLKSNDKLQMNWREDFACVYGWHKRTENQKGIWMLKIENDGTVSAFHPGKFISMDELTNVKKILEITNLASSKQVVLANNSESIPNSLLKALLVLIIALILYRLLYRVRFKVKVKKKSE